MERTGRNIKQQRLTAVILWDSKVCYFHFDGIFMKISPTDCLNEYHLICNGFSSWQLGFKGSWPKITFIYRLKKRNPKQNILSSFEDMCLFAPISSTGTIFPLPVAPSEVPFPTRCQSFTLQWKMCPISQGEVNNDWTAIEVRQTDSIQLVIAGFASVSTSVGVGRLLFFNNFGLLVLTCWGYRFWS